MSNPQSIKRRRLLALGGAAPLLLAPLSSVTAATPTRHPAVDCDPTGWCRLVPDADAARLIGRRLLEQAAVPPLPAALLRDSGLDPSWPADRLLAALRERRAMDFAAGRTVELDGWLLARCEAAFCQSLALESSRC